MSTESHILKLLSTMDDDPMRGGLVDTPKRVVSMYREMTAGRHQNPAEIMTFFESENYDQMIVSKDIPLYSLCEHHLLPFIGKAHVGYLPNGNVVGLSKLARVVNIFARRLQVQERLTENIADALEENLLPRGVMVIVEAEHLCMTMRGVQTPGTITITSAARGAFLESTRTRDEFLTLSGVGR